jgi:hypothetical protein
MEKEKIIEMTWTPEDGDNEIGRAIFGDNLPRVIEDCKKRVEGKKGYWETVKVDKANSTISIRFVEEIEPEEPKDLPDGKE